jgi:cytidylate kinase
MLNMKKIFQLINKNLSFFSLAGFQKKDKKPKPLPVITLSREKGSGGKLIADLVAKKLGKNWKVYHKEIIEKIAQETKLEKELISQIDEKNISLVEKLIGDFLGKHHPPLSTYYRQLIKILSQINQRGYAVIVGRGAEYLLPQALKIRIICEMEQRIKWLMQFEKLSRKQALEQIEKSDTERLNFIKTLYKHDQRKAHHYDLVIRTGPNLSLEDAADLIVSLAKKRFKI